VDGNNPREPLKSKAHPTMNFTRKCKRMYRGLQDAPELSIETEFQKAAAAKDEKKINNCGRSLQISWEMKSKK